MVTGGFDTDELRTEYDGFADNDDNIAQSEYAEYDVYATEDIAVAIGDGSHSQFLLGEAELGLDATGEDIVKAMIDARNGSATRLSEADEHAGALLGEQGEHPITYGAPTVTADDESLFEPSAATADTPAVQAGGMAASRSDDGTTYRITVVTEQPVSDPEAFGNELPALDGGADPSISQDGTRITYTIAETDTQPERPQAAFEVEFDLERNEAEIVHTSGDDVPADELRIIGTGSGFEAQWADLSNVTTVSPGDTVSVPISDADLGTDLLLEWLPEAELLYAESVPEGEPTTRPEAMFEVEFSLERNEAEIFHVGGDPIPADELRIIGTGSGFEARWMDLSDVATVDPGDTVSVPINDADQGADLLLEWLPESDILYGASIPGESTAPSLEAAFDVEFDMDGESVQITHTTGDEIPADELDIIFETSDFRVVTWASLTNGDTVRAGDSVEVDLTEGDSGGWLLIAWDPEPKLLHEVRIP